MYLILGRVVLFSLNQIPYSTTKNGALLLIMYTFNSVLRYFDGARKRIVQLLVILSNKIEFDKLFCQTKEIWYTAVDQISIHTYILLI